MELSTITASLAGICMAICQIPQAWMVYKTQNTNGISILMQSTLTFGCLMWLITGILMDSAPMYISNGLCVAFGLYIIACCIRNKYKK